MVGVAKACLKEGADGISLINTVKSITDVDLGAKDWRLLSTENHPFPVIQKGVKPIALRFIQQLRTAEGLENLPISGIGGIETWEDAAEFILLGSSTLQVTTAIMQYGYRIVEDMKNGLMHYMEEQGVDHLSELVGLANQNIIPAESLDRDYIVYPKIDEDTCIGCGRCYISCYDGAHQAMEWNAETRIPKCNTDKCVGCHLCALICPVHAISKGEIVIKPGRKGEPQDKKV